MIQNCGSEGAVLEILQVAFKSRRLGSFTNRTGVPVDAGSLVVVSVDRGEDLGRVVCKTEPDSVAQEEIEGRFLRIPSEDDLEKWESNRAYEREVLDHCARRIRVRNLDMRLTGCEVQLDRNRIRIFFTADQRTDFRGLVRDLASAFRARIEMRQIGVRDDAKHKDGVGICGRRLCCSGFLNSFRSITLKAVREQGLSPNPSKVSGACSRLMCCLDYETDFYRKARKTFPRPGSEVRLAGRPASVKERDFFREKVSVVYGDDREELLDIEEFHRLRTAPAVPEALPAKKEEEPVPEKPADEADRPAKKSGRKGGRRRRRSRRKKPEKEERQS